MSAEIVLVVNGRCTTVRIEPRRLLADVLRDEFRLADTHVACEYGVCSTGTVLQDDESIRSCLVFAVQAAGCRVTTVEGLGTAEHLHPLQRSFWEEHGLQRGFCTAGFLLRAEHLLRSNPDPNMGRDTRGTGRQHVRCTGYQFIVNAVRFGRGRSGRRKILMGPAGTSQSNARPSVGMPRLGRSRSGS
jgi:carbon-monoxide dehydrogenase small subunit